MKDHDAVVRIACLRLEFEENFRRYELWRRNLKLILGRVQPVETEFAVLEMFSLDQLGLVRDLLHDESELGYHCTFGCYHNSLDRVQRASMSGTYLEAEQTAKGKH